MFGSRSISSTIASRSASRKLRVRVSGIDVLQQRLGSRDRRPLRELDRVLHARLGLVVDPAELLLVGDPEPEYPLPEHADRVALHPLLDLFLGSVLGCVGHRVTAEAVR